MEKRYGLTTASAMVVGIVIGSGVFFKAEAVLRATGGDLGLGVLAWIIGGAVMISCANAFAALAGKYDSPGGVVGYARAMVGPRYAYYMGWFLAAVYYPAMTAVVSWAAARYLCLLTGMDVSGGGAMTLAGLFLVLLFGLNALSPVLAGRVQVAATAVKLLPLLLMAVGGVAVGIGSGRLAEDLAKPGSGGGLLASVVSVAFAYEGWIVATTISGELKNPRRDLPLALLLGSLIVMGVYIAYYLGLAGAVGTEELMTMGESAARHAFRAVLGEKLGACVFSLIVVSCLGGLNGMMMANCRSFYTLARREEDPAVFASVGGGAGMPLASSIMGLLVSELWLLHFYGGNLAEPTWFGPFCYDTAVLPVVTLYAMYIPIFLRMIFAGVKLTPLARYAAPVPALAGCAFMIYATFQAHGKELGGYLALFAAVMLAGAALRKRTAQT